MCDNENKEDTVVYHSAKINGIDIFEDDSDKVLNWAGEPFNKYAF